MCTVGATTSFLGKLYVQGVDRGHEHGTTYGCLLNDDVFDNEFLEFQALGVSICFGILQEAGDEFDRFLGPATCGRDVGSLGKV